MRRLASTALLLAGELASLVAVALGLLVLAVDRAPLGLGPLRAPVLQLVQTSAVPLHVMLADLILRRSPTTGRLELEARHIEVRDANDLALLVAGRAALAADLDRSLRAGRVVLDRVTVLEPQIRLHRGDGGGIVPAAEGSGPIAWLVGLLGGAGGARLPLSLEALAVEGAVIELIDELSGRSLRLRDGTALLERGRGLGFATLALEQPTGPAHLAVLLARTVTPGGIAWAAEAVGLSPVLLDPTLPPTPLERVQAAGTLADDRARLEVDWFRIEIGGSSFDGRGWAEVRFGAFDLNGRISGLDRDRLLAFWPEGVAVETRAWTEVHIRAGRVEAELRARQTASGGPVVWSLSGTAEGVLLQGLLSGRAVQAARLVGRLDERAVEASGALRIDGQPLELASLRHELWTRSRPKSVGRLRGRLAADRLGAIVPELAGPLSGSLAADLSFDLGRDGSLAVRLDADLQDLGVSVPDLSLTKATGQPGKLVLAADKRGERVRISSLAPGWPGLILDGRATVTWPGLHASGLELDRSRIARSELVASLRLDRGRLTGRISGPLLVLNPWLGGGPAGGDLPALALDLALDRVEAGGLVLLDLQGRIEREQGIWRVIELAAGHAGGGAFRIGLQPREGVPRLELRSDRAGLLLEAVDPAADLADGGRLLLDGVLGQDAEDTTFEGRLEVRDVVIRRAPILARILTLAPLGGILDVLTGRGLRLDRIDAGLSLARGVLAVAEGRASGSQLGITAAGTIDLVGGTLELAGTVVPVYTLNRFVGQLPLVGRLLRGEDGVGAFAATWSARGPAAAPAISVNPLTLVVPGFLRDLAALLAQRAEPAEAAPRDRSVSSAAPGRGASCRPRA